MSTTQQPSQQYFTIQGNIGCGKTTFLNMLKKHCPEIQFLAQPVDQWRNVNNTNVNILQAYYEDSHRWGLTFLNYALLTRIKSYHDLKELDSESIIISQRSYLSDKNVFYLLMKQLGTLNQTQAVLFESVYESHIKISKLERPKIIYLKSTPQICKQRTGKRQRSQQSQIPLEYFQKLHEKHQNWMKQQDPNNVLVVDTSQQFDGSEERLNNILKQLKSFLKKNNV